jgi:hypothetical protein
VRDTRPLLGVALLLATAPLEAQNLNPRAFWPAPAGTNVLSVGYAYAEGSMLFDPSLPIEHGEAESHALKLGYVRYFGLAGRTASLAVEIPRGEGDLTGLVNEQEAERRLSGLGDVSVRLAFNLVGAPRMTPEQFREFLGRRDSLLGLSLRVEAPTGQYDPDRFINLGTNRWSARTEIGYVSAWKGWVNELTAGVRFFGDNDEFVGHVREQDPLATIELHVGRAVRRARPDFWFSVGIVYANGGRTTLDGIENDDLQQNAAVGATLGIPLGKAQALRIGFNTSIRTSIGGDATTGLLAYSKAWR